MATLNGQQISATYEGLIKTANNQAGAPFPPAKLQYGDGTELPISIGDGTGVGIGDIVTIASGTRQIDVNSQNLALVGVTNIDAAAGTAAIANGTYNFGNPFVTTNVDFTNATVTGLPGGAAGLENGTGTDSLQSAAALTTTAADASGNYSIALGDGASATRQESVAIGQNATANGSGSDGSIAIGNGAVAGNNRSVVIGVNNSSTSSEGIAIGDDVDIAADRSIGIGNSINISGGNDKVAIGTAAAVSGQRGLAFGQNASATANEAIAMGYNVTAATAQTLSVNALETQTNSTPTAGGIIMSDAGGTDRRLNVNASGGLQIGTTPAVIPGWSTTKVSENQAASSCDTTRASVLIPAGSVKAGDILQVKSLEQRSGSSGFTYSNIAIHTAGTIGQTQAGAFVSGHQNSSDGFGVHSKNLFVQTVDGTGDGTIYLEDNYTPQEQQGQIFSTTLGSFTAIDWTVDQYLCVNVCIDNSGTTWTNYGASLTIIGRN